MRLLLTAATLSLAIAPSLANADEGALLIGAGAGVFITDPLEALSTSWTVNPRVGYEFIENGIAEFDLAISMGETRTQDVPYTALTPMLGFRGILIDQLPRYQRDENGKRVMDENGNPVESGTRVSPIQPFLSVGVGVLYKNVSDPDALAYIIPNPDIDFIVKAGPGVQVPVGNHMMLRTDYKIVANFGSERFNNHGDTLIQWEWTAGIDFLIGGGKDTDGDGISDNRDSCPAVAEDLDGWQDEDGCVDDDNDGDGILDLADQCPVDAGTVGAMGCPDGDEDGIRDSADDCPTLAGPAEFNGCPDSDGDGVLDPDDECPQDVGPEASFGCADGDEDLVPDYRDDCPEEKANEGINPKRSDGCPSRVFVAIDGIVITEKVFFDSGRATIQRRSYGLLDDVGATLNAYPGITKVEIQGHTDSQGAEASNQTLSQNRASAVVLYLAAHDVATERLVAVGYGEGQPKDDNDTRSGRANNRRVEFKILEETQQVEVMREDEVPEGVETVPVEEIQEAETSEQLEDVIEEIQDLVAPE
jgi:outer membrane protein OmpA-like peptidoglycan-associated protein